MNALLDSALAAAVLDAAVRGTFIIPDADHVEYGTRTSLSGYTGQLVRDAPLRVVTG